MLKSNGCVALLYDVGGSYEVVGPPDVVKVGDVRAYHPKSRSERTVWVGQVAEYKGSYGDGTWVVGQPSGGKLCGAHVPGKGNCDREYAHGGWCRGRSIPELDRLLAELAALDA